MSLPQSALEEVLGLLGSCSANSRAQDPAQSTSVDGDDGISRLRGFLQFDKQDTLVDTALSMLGFTTSTMQHSFGNVLVRSLISVLSSTISCGNQAFLSCVQNAASRCAVEYVSTFIDADDNFAGKCKSGNDEPRRESAKVYVGETLSPSAVRKIVEISLNFLKSAKLEESLALELLEVLVKTTSVISVSKSTGFGTCLFYEKKGQNKARRSPDATASIIDLLLQFAMEEKEALYSRFSPSTRLLLWRLQPQLLRQDLSKLLQKVAERPLLQLKDELRQERGWRNLIVALAFGPDVFAEARRTFNVWLLFSGVQFIWELKAELCAAVHNVLEKPSCWDLSVAAGADLPPISMFYHSSFQYSLTILTRPPSWSGLIELVSLFDKEVSLESGCSFSFGDEDLLSGASKNGVQFENGKDQDHGCASFHEPFWALLMDFPLWLQFASITIFKCQCTTHQSFGCYDHAVVPSGLSLLSKTSCTEGLVRLTHKHIAAKYISWLFSPHDRNCRDQVVRLLVQMAESWRCIQGKICTAEENRYENLPLKRRRPVVENWSKHAPTVDLQKTGGPDYAHCNLNSFLGKKDTLLSSNAGKVAVQAVQQWLVNFQNTRRFIDNFICLSASSCCNKTGIINRHQAKRRLLMNKASTTTDKGEIVPPMNNFATQSVACSCHSRMSTFFDSLPLVALSSSPSLQSDAAVSLILNFIVVEFDSPTRESDGNGTWSVKVHTDEHNPHQTQAATFNEKGLIFREPWHRTEDFKDLCSTLGGSESFPSSSWVMGAATIFKVLETLDLHEASEFVNGSDGLEWLDGFKNTIAKQLIECIHRWSLQSDSRHLFLLDDLQRRASKWATQAGLQADTLRAFNQAVQSLDILIASSLVDA